MLKYLSIVTKKIGTSRYKTSKIFSLHILLTIEFFIGLHNVNILKLQQFIRTNNLFELIENGSFAHKLSQ